LNTIARIAELSARKSIFIISDQVVGAAEIQDRQLVHLRDDLENPFLAFLALSFGLPTASGITPQLFLQGVRDGIAHAIARALGEFSREGRGFGIVDVDTSVMTVYLQHLPWVCQLAAMLSSVTLSFV
jgi:hypothetical protein